MAYEFTDEETKAYAEDLARRVDVTGPRVRVIRATCIECSEEGHWPPFTVAAAVLRELATQQHHDTCTGRMQFETEPVE